MSNGALLTSLLPIRDRRDRVVGYAVTACPVQGVGVASAEDDGKRLLEAVTKIARLAGRSVVVPVTPAQVRDGAVTRFASTDAVWLLATDALEEERTRKAVDRLLSQGFHFALDGFPEGEPLSNALSGSTIVLDAWRTTPALLESRIRTLLSAGLRPLVRGIDDRAARHRAIAAGAPLHMGRLLIRPSAARVDRTAEESVVRSLTMLAAFADGRAANAAFDAYVQDDPNIGASLLRAMSSAALGVRGPRSVTHAMTMLGRDAVMEQLVSVTARLIGEAAGDPELAFVALRRARLCERTAAALDAPPHQRARSVAGLLSVLEFAFGVPAASLLDRIELPPSLRDTLEQRRLPLGKLLDVVDALDYGWWDDMRDRCAALGISPLVVSQANLDAWREARDELGILRPDAS